MWVSVDNLTITQRQGNQQDEHQSRNRQAIPDGSCRQGQEHCNNLLRPEAIDDKASLDNIAKAWNFVRR